MDWQRVALGIGNPGADYEDTRHNVGFMVMDRVAAKLGLSFSRLQRRTPDGRRLFGGKVKAQIAQGPASGNADRFVLVKPLTYVNLSGDVAGALLRARELPPESLFVVVDDLNLPLGRMRVRPAGSAGGHNGLASIEQALCSQDFPRLRLGIGVPGPSSMVDHVLAPFSAEERQVLGPMLDRSAEAVCEWLDGMGLQSLMERFNARPPDESSGEAQSAPEGPTGQDGQEPNREQNL